MSDFYDLLKQSIIERGIRSAEGRAAIYAQAREAISKQLWDYRPPLAADEIDMRVGAFDRAVERIEADLAERFAGGKAFVPGAGRSLARPAPAIGPGDTGLPLDGWIMDEADEPPGDDDPSPYAPPPERPRGAPSAGPERAAPRVFLHEEDAVLEGDEAAYDDETAPPLVAEDDDFVPPFIRDEDPEDVDVDEEPDAAPRRGRWFGRQRDDHDEEAHEDILVRVSVWLTGLMGSGEQRRVRLLALAVGALFIVLVGFAAFVLGSRHRTVAVDTQTTPSGVEISDAATAARIPDEALTVTASYSLFDGKDPSIFQSLPDNPIRFDGNTGVARIGTSASASGVKVAIGPGLASELAGRRVRIVVTARASADQGATGMRFAYQSGLALSYWQRANLGKDFAAVGMIWRLPALRTSGGDDYILIEPGIPGDGSGADIKSIRIDVLAS